MDFFTTRAYVTFALTVRVEMTVYLFTYLLILPNLVVSGRIA